MNAAQNTFLQRASKLSMQAATNPSKATTTTVWKGLSSLLTDSALGWRPVRELSTDYYPQIGWLNSPKPSGYADRFFEVRMRAQDSSDPKRSIHIGVNVSVQLSNEIHSSQDPKHVAAINKNLAALGKQLKSLDSRPRSFPPPHRPEDWRAISCEWKSPSLSSPKANGELKSCRATEPSVMYSRAPRTPGDRGLARRSLNYTSVTSRSNSVTTTTSNVPPSASCRYNRPLTSLPNLSLPNLSPYPHQGFPS